MCFSSNGQCRHVVKFHLSSDKDQTAPELPQLIIRIWEIVCRFVCLYIWMCMMCIMCMCAYMWFVLPLNTLRTLCHIFLATLFARQLLNQYIDDMADGICEKFATRTTFNFHIYISCVRFN